MVTIETQILQPYKQERNIFLQDINPPNKSTKVIVRRKQKHSEGITYQGVQLVFLYFKFMAYKT